jgi:hypothetical protein
MAQASCRILLVDSSVPRVQALSGTLAMAGWEIWPGRTVQDALLLATGLPFQIVLAHEATMREHPELWKQLAELIPAACWLVHGEEQSRLKAGRGGVLASDPALILAVLMLLLEQQPASRAQAA